MSQSITEGICSRILQTLFDMWLVVYGEYRTGKTQLAHTMCLVSQLPVELGGAAGKVCSLHMVLMFSRAKQIRSRTSTQKVLSTFS